MTKQALLKSIGERIGILRKEKGLKAENVAKTLDLSKGTYSNIENGEVDSKVSRLMNIAQVLETPLQTFFCDNSAGNQQVFNDYRSEINRLNRLVEILICRNEYLTEQVDDMQNHKVA